MIHAGAAFPSKQKEGEVAFIETVPVSDATGEVAELYRLNQEDWGFVPNYAKVYSRRPGVLMAWGELIGAIRRNIDGRRYELATIAAARALRSSYCMLAHGPRLAGNYASTAEATAICGDFRTADLSDADVAVMSYAEKIVRDATSVTQDDIDELRRHGLTDDDIFDVAVTAAARCFFSKVPDALGAAPDATLGEIDPAFRDALVVGRAISEEPVETMG